jgi:hypothetical protein
MIYVELKIRDFANCLRGKGLLLQRACAAYKHAYIGRVQLHTEYGIDIVITTRRFYASIGGTAQEIV